MFALPVSLRIDQIIVENPFVKTFVFQHHLGAQPGQFVNVWIPRVNEKPMSVAYCDENEFWLSIFAVGPFSKKMHEFQVGDLVGIRGPYGKGFSFAPKSHLILVGGGYGAAPLYFLASAAVAQGCTVDFILGARSQEYLLYLDRIQALPGVKLHIATDDGSVGFHGYNTLVLENLLQHLPEDRSLSTVYTCGPELMMKRVSDLSFQYGVSAQISLERYMKCGFGVCGQCTVDNTGERMCVEGPVLTNDQARKVQEFGVYHRDDLGKKHYF